MRLRSLCAAATDRPLVQSLQFPRPMASRLRLLLIASWQHRTVDLRASLQRHGLSAQIARVDTEPALRAALARARYAAAIYIDHLRDLAIDLVQTQLLLQAPNMPLVVVKEVADAGPELARVLQLE